MLRLPRYPLLAVTFLLSLCCTAAPAQQPVAVAKPAAALTPAERDAASQVSAKTIREVTAALAAKEMEGRGTAQPGADRAAKYIAGEFARIGLRPGGDANTYLQAIKFKVETVLPDSSLKVGETAFKYKEDFVIAQPLPAESQVVAGGVVFVGYGVVSDELKRNDLAGIDVKGKIVMLLAGRPKNADAAAWARAASQQAVFGQLIAKGATGFIFRFAGRETQPFPLIAAYLSRRRVALADAPQPPFKSPPVALISDAAAEKIFASAGKSFAQAREALEAGEFVSADLGIPATLSAQIKREDGVSSNVVGVLDGSDAKLKDEAVVYTAHYDAYGIDLDDTIYPGAGDNAIGTAKLVAIAEVMAKMKPRPRRSVLFIALTGEEYGLLGAEHWVKQPTWPIEKVAADINYDGIGTDAWGPLGFLIDLGFKHSSLSELIQEVSAANNVTIIPDPSPEEGFFYRSDNYPFFKKGVPALYLVGGPAGNPLEVMGRVNKWLTTTYHMAGDTIQPDWNWDGARSLAVIGLISGLRIAERDQMPAWKADSPYNRPRGTNLPPPPRQ